MYVLVKYQDGVKKIVASSDIKHFDATRISYSKKYKVKWENEEYYEAVIIIVGDTESEVEEKAAKKRQKITPFEICESADDTDASMLEKINDKNNNGPKDQIKHIVTKKIEKLQLNLDEYVKGQAGALHRLKKPIGGPLSCTTSTLKGNVKKSASASNQNDSKDLANLDKQTNKRPAVVLKKDIPSVKKVDSKITAKVNPKDSRKPVVVSANEKTATREMLTGNGKHCQEFKQKDQKMSNVATKASGKSSDHSAGEKNQVTAGDKGKHVIRKDRQETKQNVQKITTKVATKDSGKSPNGSTSQKTEKLATESSNRKLKESLNLATKNNDCDSCQKVEKKLQDVTRELRNLERTNTQFKQALKDKDKMLEEATRLNMDLQCKVLDEFDELKVIIGDMKQRAQENLAKNQGILPVGYKRLDKSLIHLGQDVWITIPQYDSISCLSDTSAKFVKNLAIAVFGTTTLKGSSVTGVVSNRIKNKNVNAIARPKLDATKLLAIKDALGFWLRTEKHVDEVSIDIEVTRVGSHISHKIFELLRKEKKPDVELPIDFEPQVVLFDENSQPVDVEEDNDDQASEASNGTGQRNDDTFESGQETLNNSEGDKIDGQDSLDSENDEEYAHKSDED